GHVEPSDTYDAFRAAAVDGYNYTDSSGLTQVMDLAVTASKTGGVHTVNLTNPYTPTVIGTVKNEDGTIFKAFASDIAISRNSGLAFITSGGAIYVIDIKDPFNPIMLNKIDAAPVGENGVIDELLGEVKALVEKDGWVYLASTDGGLRVLDLDPVYLKWIKVEGEIEGISSVFSEDYYPALGSKTIILQGFNANNGPFKADEIVKVRLKTILANVDVNPLTGYECPGEETNNKCARFIFDENLGKNGASIVKFTVAAATLTGLEEKINLLFEVDMASLSSRDRISNFSTGVPKESVSLNVRHNGNVTMKDVLAGDAVFVFDENNERRGEYNEADTEETRKVYYVNELLNQILTRKRGIGNFQLLDEESGFYDQQTADAIGLFKSNFGMSLVKETVGNEVRNHGNTVAMLNFDPVTKAFSYDATDDTSPIFRKLMKDYGKREAGESANWLNRIIDKGLLVGTEQKEEDYLVNNAANTENDTGLKELYANVVVPFVGGMIDKGNEYVNYGESFRSRRDRVVQGVSYSFGNHMRIDEFTTYKSETVGAPLNYPICNPTFENNYCADNEFYNYRGSLGDADPENMYAGLKEHEYNRWMNSYFNLDNNNHTTFIPDDHYFYPLHWAGIDCSGFVQRMVNAADPVTNSGSDVPPVTVNVKNLEDYFEACDDLSCYRRNRSWNEYYFNDQYEATYNKSLVNNRIEMLKKLKRGDVLQYRGHIAMVYSDRVDCSGGNNVCDYQIIHAHGVHEICSNQENLPEVNCVPDMRKVIIQTINSQLRSDNLINPRRMGRFMLWD
ncbi:MAG: hypothetical protein OEV42_21355, partial [Deltaproteobacteria bacterium]|nr:hypothetical protein [Deltaproteobacteria bacterium]